MSGKEKTNGSLAMAPRVITIPAASQENTRKLRVAAYARVSSNSEDQKHSFAAQNAYYSKLITGNPDWELADIYADQGITGTSIDKRDDFLRMMEDPEWQQKNYSYRFPVKIRDGNSVRKI